MVAQTFCLIPDWPAPSNVHAAVTLRFGGVSLPPFDSLNPAFHVGDDPAAVEKNRQLINAGLKLPAEPFWLEQIHSNRALEANPEISSRQADAGYSGKPSHVCVVMTADCLPILMCDRQGQFVAAIHAGWRGLVSGIIENTLAAMPNRDWLVWLGPAIGPESFEVGEDVREAFMQKSPEFSAGFRRGKPGKWLADIYVLAKVQFSQLRIKNIYGGGFCTVNDAQRFYSYRRDKQTGRMAALIWRD